MKKFVFIGVLLSLWIGNVHAQIMPGRQYQEGVHYFKIDQAPVQRDSVEVTEVFSYLCNHCATFEPYMQSWMDRKPENVKLKRIPVSFGRRAWEIYARAYVAASLMGIEEESHVAMMDALWKERRQMRSLDELADFYTQFGVEKAAFLATADSFAVDAQMRREQRQAAGFGITGTPAVVVNGVNGDYRISSSEQVSSFEAMLAVVDYLVTSELGALAPQVETAAEAATTSDAANN
jgi:thiol:disulfide interchange protein DsbA